MSASTLSWAESLLKQLGLLDIPQSHAQFDPDSAPTYPAETVATGHRPG